MGERIQVQEKHSPSSRRHEIVDQVIVDAQSERQQAATERGKAKVADADDFIQGVEDLIDEVTQSGFSAAQYIQRGGE